MELSLIYIICGRAIPAIVTGYVVFCFMERLYERRYSEKIYGILYVAFVLVTLLVMRRRNFPFNYIYIFLCLFIISRFLYNGPSKKSLVNSFCFMIYITGAQVIGLPLHGLLRYQKALHSIERPEGTLITGLISGLVWVCTYKLVIGALNHQKMDKTKLTQYIFMIFMGAFEYAVVYRLIGYTKEMTDGGVLLWIGGSFLAIDIYLIHLFSNIEKKEELEKSVALLNQQTLLNHKYYENMEQTFLQMRRSLHDVKNHIQVLEETYGAENQYGEALQQSIQGIGGRFYCSNRILNIIINVKKKECEREEIPIQLNIENIKEFMLDDMEITTIFSNLFDNAIEALKLVEPGKRMLKLNVMQVKSSNLIWMENAYNGMMNVIPKKGHWGIGLANIQGVVDKHAGSIVIDSEGKTFKINIVIPIVKRL